MCRLEAEAPTKPQLADMLACTASENQDPSKAGAFQPVAILFAKQTLVEYATVHLNAWFQASSMLQSNTRCPPLLCT
jgi:hypothetical protein